MYEGVDSNKIGMWGHSMGGHITLESMVVSKDIKVIYNARNTDDGTLFPSDEKKDLIDDLIRVRIGLTQKGLQIMKELEQNKE